MSWGRKRRRRKRAGEAGAQVRRRWSELRPWVKEGIGGAAVSLRGPVYRAEEQGARSAAGASEVRSHAVLTQLAV